MDFLSSEGSDKLVKRSDFCLLIISGKCVIFQLEKKMCEWSLKRASLISVIVSLQDKTNRNKFIIFREVVW